MRRKPNNYLNIDGRVEEDRVGQERNGNNIQERQRNRIKNSHENGTG